MAAWAAMGASIRISSEAMINHPCFDGSQHPWQSLLLFNLELLLYQHDLFKQKTLHLSRTTGPAA
jgi:hypothetical protein